MISISGIFILGVVFSGCASNGIQVTQAECLNKPSVNNMFVAGECLNYEKFDGHKKGKVIVFLHGSSTSFPNPISYVFDWGQNLKSRTGVTTYILNLPGYAGSSANNWYRMYQTGRSYNAVNPGFVKFTADMLQSIKEREESSELYVVGHSSGATLAATISGYKPGLIQKVMAYEGNYDVDYYRAIRGWSNKYHATDFMTYKDEIDKKTKFLNMYGMKSTKSKPEESLRFTKMLKENGLFVKTIAYPEMGHNMYEDEVFDEVVKFVNN